MSTRTFPNDAVSVAKARHHLTDTLRDVPAETRDVVELILSEIASNCVRHTSSSFNVSVNSSVERIRVEVSDQGSGIPEMRSPLPTEPNGRGLRVVDLLSERWGVRTNDPFVGKTIWFDVANPTVGSFGSSAARGQVSRQDLTPEVHRLHDDIALLAVERL